MVQMILKRIAEMVQIFSGAFRKSVEKMGRLSVFDGKNTIENARVQPDLSPPLRAGRVSPPAASETTAVTRLQARES